jgi:hypothetical protein
MLMPLTWYGVFLKPTLCHKLLSSIVLANGLPQNGAICKPFLLKSGRILKLRTWRDCFNFNDPGTPPGCCGLPHELDSEIRPQGKPKTPPKILIDTLPILGWFPAIETHLLN